MKNRKIVDYKVVSFREEDTFSEYRKLINDYNKLKANSDTLTKDIDFLEKKTKAFVAVDKKYFEIFNTEKNHKIIPFTSNEVELIKLTNHYFSFQFPFPNYVLGENYFMNEEIKINLYECITDVRVKLDEIASEIRNKQKELENVTSSLKTYEDLFQILEINKNYLHLEGKVKQEIDLGYEPIGGVILKDNYFYQALVKYEEE